MPEAGPARPQPNHAEVWLQSRPAPRDLPTGAVQDWARSALGRAAAYECRKEPRGGGELRTLGPPQLGFGVAA